MLIWYCYWRRYVASKYLLSMYEMVLVLLDCTRNVRAMRVSCPVLPRLHLKATETRKEKLRATSYLQNFSSYHACGLHSKCLLLVASCDQSRNSSLHLLAQFFSPNLICSPGCFVSYTSGGGQKAAGCTSKTWCHLLLLFEFRWCSCIITHQAVADWYCAAMPKNHGSSLCLKKVSW